jgi:hypothetical protein
MRGAGPSGFCTTHDPAKAANDGENEHRRQQSGEVLELLHRVAKAKGWESSTTHRDKATWKFATVHVRHWNGARWTTGNIEMTFDDGVKFEAHPLGGSKPGLNSLFEAVMSEARKLPWAAPAPPVEVPAPSKVASRLPTLRRILHRFHNVARQLLHRHDDRDAIVINDEYDVQDLLHGLLRGLFDDVRAEEYTPSYAGSSSRVDFLIKEEKAVVETKMTNVKLRDKQVGEQLIIDISRYQAHPDCQYMLCLVYDPGGFLKNPAGLVADLTRRHGELDVTVIVSP